MRRYRIVLLFSILGAKLIICNIWHFLKAALKILIVLAIMLLASQPATVLITIDSSGIVEAHLRLNVVEGLNEVRLPAEPIPETIEVKVGGEYAVAIY
ncbi:MAG: hypothetical protein QW819_05865, partial [Candidatus Korarchaeota archaeon]|nr:hypothetical protein [Thermoproteota archaeon]